MDSVNSPPDTQSKLPGLALNFLASLGAGLNAGSATSGPFADLMAQIKTSLSLNSNSGPNQTATLSKFQHSPQNQNSSNANTTNAPNSPSDQTSVDPQDAAAPQKFLKQQTKTDTGKSNADNSGNDNSSPQVSDQPQQNNDTQATIDGSTQVTTTTKSPVPDTSPAGTNDANATNSDTLVLPPVADTVTNPVMDPNANGLNILLSTNVDTSASSSAITDESMNNSGKTNTSPGDEILESDLMMLLLELERLATAQLAASVTAGNANTATTGASQSPNADGTQAQTVPSANTDNKIDLKGLLAAIAGLNDGTQANIATSGQNNTALTGDAQDAAAAAAAATTALQSSVSASSDTSQSAGTTNKWMNADFLNLFNLSNNSSGTPVAPLAFNPAATAGAMAGGDGNASLDSNTQGQNGASARNSATGLTANSNASLSATGTVQPSNPYDFASQLSALRATRGGAAGLPTPIEQVVLQLSRGLSKDGSSQMSIQLRPAELGRIDVKLNVDSEGKVQGIVSADNPHTLHLLLKDVGGLERALQEAGLRADSGCLQFNLRGDGQPGGSEQNAGTQAGLENGNTPTDSLFALSEFTEPGETYYLTPGGVNIRV